MPAPITSKNVSPQDILTQKKRQLLTRRTQSTGLVPSQLSNRYVSMDPPTTYNKYASTAVAILAGHTLQVTPAFAGGDHTNQITLGTAPCCSS